MNDLDDLIRASLHDHAAPEAPDDGLAGRVQTVGRRVRRTRVALGGAAAVAAVVAVVWGASILPGRTQPVIAASPEPTASVQTTVKPTPTSATSTPEPTPTATFPPGNVRDVSKIGSPAEYGKYSFLNNYFASPTGNFQCFINTAGAGCTGRDWDPGVEPAQSKVCADTEPVIGPEVWGTKKAAWECGSDPHSFPYLVDDEPSDGVAWWDVTFGEKLPAPWDTTQTLAVLPYGKTLVAGDFRCTMAEAGVTCVNTRTGEGFTASRSKVDLTP